MRMIKVAQKAQDASLVRELHEHFRILLCTPAGLAPGDKEWTELVKQITASIDTVSSESDLPAFCFICFKEMKWTKVGTLLLNYTIIEALKWYRMPMARTMMSGGRSSPTAGLVSDAAPGQGPTPTSPDSVAGRRSPGDAGTSRW